jgi:hypothetical protein
MVAESRQVESLKIDQLMVRLDDGPGWLGPVAAAASEDNHARCKESELPSV